VSFGSASHAKAAAPKRRSREGGPVQCCQRTSFGSVTLDLWLSELGFLDEIVHRIEAASKAGKNRRPLGPDR